MSAIQCLKPAELVEIADLSCEDNTAGPNWLLRTFYSRDIFSPTGRFRMVQFDTWRGSVGRHVCDACETAPGTERRNARVIKEMTIPHLKYEDYANWCQTTPERYVTGAVPWEEMDDLQKWELITTEKVEDQLLGHFTTLNVQGADGLKYGATRIHWANPDETAEDAMQAELRDIVHGRPDDHLLDLNDKDSKWKPWGGAREIKDIGIDIYQMAERIHTRAKAPVTDVVMGPGTFAFGIQAAKFADKHFNGGTCDCEVPTDGDLSFNKRPAVDCDKVINHGTWNGVRYWSYIDSYTDKDGVERYYIDPGHALFVANGLNGVQGIIQQGGINHPEVYKRDLPYFLRQTESGSGLVREQRFWSRAMAYPGKPTATIYAKVLPDSAVKEFMATQSEINDAA